MKKLLKFVGVLVGLVVLLVVVAVVAAPLLIDPNDYKDRIAAEVKKATGRDLSVPGEIELSVFPWLGVALGEASLGNAAGFSAPVFARTEKVDVKVRLQPLLSRRVEVSTVTLEGLTLNLERDAEGRSNWEDLGGAGGEDSAGDTAGQQPDAGEGGEPAIAALAIGGVNLRNATVSWNDRQLGQRVELSEVNLETGAISPGSPTPLTASLKIAGELGEGQDLSGGLDLSATVTADPEAGTAQLEAIDFMAKLEGGAVQGGAVSLGVKGASASVDGNTLAGTLTALAVKLDVGGGPLGEGKATVNLALPAAALDGAAQSVRAAQGLALDAVVEGGPLGAGGTASVKLASPELALDGAAGAVNAAQGLTVDATVKGGPMGDGNADVKAATGALSLNAAGAGTVGGLEIDGRFSGGPLQAGKGTVTVKVPSLSLDAAAKAASLDALDLAADLEGEQFPGGRAKVSLDAKSLSVDANGGRLEIGSFALNALDLAMRGAIEAAAADGGARFDGNVEVDPFNLRSLLAALGQAAPETADPNALTSVAFQAKLGGTGRDLALQPFSLRLDESTLAGTLKVANLSSPAVRFDLELDRIDADRYLPPEGSVKPSTPGQAAAGGAQGAPLDGLRKLNASGTFRAGQVKVAKMNFAAVSAALDAKGGLIRLSPVTAKLYRGAYAGNIALDARGDALKIGLNEKISGVQVGELLKDLTGDDRISGTANVTAKLDAAGADADAVKRTLAGAVNFSFSEGALKGVNVGRMIREAKATLQGKTLPPADGAVKTDFSEMTGSINFVNGVGTNDDFLAKSPLLRIQGKGTANLPTEAVDYRVMTTIVGTSRGQGGKELEDLKGVPIPLKVGGTFTQPTYGLDVEALATELAKSKAKELLDAKTEKIQKEVTEKVTKKIEEKVGAEAAEQLEAIGGEKAKGLLKGLLGN